MTALWFIIAAAFGAVARYAASARLPGNAGTAIATLYVNVVGSFLAGLLAMRSADTRTVFAVGLLGAFTTFSTFVLVASSHANEGRTRAAASYVLITVAGCVAAAWLGLTAAEQGWT